MATTARHQTTSVVQQQIEIAPERFGFMQVVRLLSRFVKDIDESIQFAINPNQRFPISDVDSLHIANATTPRKQYKLVVNFLGLIGQDGILPAHINALIIQRLQQKDDSLLEFLQLFQHHLLRLYKDLLQRRHFVMNVEQHKPDVTLTTLDSISGQPQTKSEFTKRYAGLYVNQARSAEGLRELLSSHFELPVDVTQYTPRWLTLDKSDITILGGKGQQQMQLGQTAILGSRVWHVQNHFTVWVGPLELPEFIAFLPKGHYFAELKNKVNDYIGLEHDFSVKLLLKRQAIPRCELRYQGAEKLGWTTWLQGEKAKTNYVTVTLNYHRQEVSHDN